MVNPAAAHMDKFTLEVEAGNRAVDAEHQFTSVRSIITDRPHLAVLGPHEEVKLAFADERDGTDATRGPAKTWRPFQVEAG